MKTYWMAGLSLAVLTAATPALSQQAIRIGGAVSGALEGGDERLSSGEYVDIYEFQGRAGQTVTVGLGSTAFDPYLLMRGPSGFSQDNDDRASGDTSSEISARLPARTWGAIADCQ